MAKRIEERAVNLALKVDEWWSYVWLIGDLLRWGEPFLDLPEGRKLKRWLDDCDRFQDGIIVALEEIDRACIKARREAGLTEGEVKRMREKFRRADDRGRRKILDGLFRKADSLLKVVKRESEAFWRELERA